jgi:phenazine biosynthesis protein phzE
MAVNLAEKITYNYSEAEYAQLVETIIKQEIGQGAGANFVIERQGQGQIADFEAQKALAIFHNLLKRESGSHWTFFFADKTRFLIGASPESHISVQNGRVKMHPISGTFRKGAKEPLIKTRKRFLEFIRDRKEISELYMVVDEELKMMAELCSEGGMIIGPLLKEMSEVIHTEYLLSGKTNKSALEVLKNSLYAATVVGSPLENACKIIKRYESGSRGFYAGALALLGKDQQDQDQLDSAILIRTMEVSRTGKLQFGSGATLVRDSQGVEEVKETVAKSKALLNSLEKPSNEHNERLLDYFEEDDEVLEALEERNQKLSTFWFLEQDPDFSLRKELAGKKVTIINNEDDFCLMLKHLLQFLGLKTKVVKFKQFSLEQDQSDLLVIGPGPGDPTKDTDPKIAKLLADTKEILASRRPFLAVCLGNQLLCRALGLEVVKKKQPFQGVQEQIKLFGKEERVGFYNTFVGKKGPTTTDVEIVADPQTEEIHALFGTNFAGVQFHPESILTQNGLKILKKIINNLFK